MTLAGSFAPVIFAALVKTEMVKNTRKKKIDASYPIC